MDNDIMNFVRKEWLSFLKWTAGLSVFLITAILSILVYRDEVVVFRILPCYQQISLLSSGISLFLTLVGVWILHRYSISKFYPDYNKLLKVYENMKQANIIKNGLKHEKAYGEAVSKFKKEKSFINITELIVTILFGIGFGSSIFFLFTYLIN